MKIHPNLALLSAVLTLSWVAPETRAATAILGYDNSTDGNVLDQAFPYLAKVTFSQFDSWSTPINPTPGTWSYANLNPTANQNSGWGHASRWYLVELTAASNFTISMATTSTSANPGFVVYTGESINDNPDLLHTYSNNGLDTALLNDPWNTNGDLSYHANAYNGKVTNLSKSFNLPAGLYTIGFGNAADPNDIPASPINYDISLRTIPEPSALLLLGGASLLTLSRRRR